MQISTPTLSEKKRFHAELKQLHGAAWTSQMKPAYDKRGHASLLITQFDPVAIARMPTLPVEFLQIEPAPNQDPEVVRNSIPILLDRFGAALEWLDLRNTFSISDDTEHMRDILPSASDCFANLPELNRVDFTRVDVTDRIVKSLIASRRLERFSVDEALITKRSIKYLASLENLRIVVISQCRHFRDSYQDALQERLPDVEIVRIRGNGAARK